MYYLGIDGGGTKTRYILVDDKLEKVGDVESGTIHIHQVGVEGIKKELRENISKICSNVNIEPKDIAFIFAGVPGYGESLEDKVKIDQAIREVMEAPYMIDNDAVNGWAAGTACKAGINVVAGTGSIAYGRNDEGMLARCGGFGPGIGDDGSAYWIGLRTINEYTKQRDGREEKTALLDVLEREYNISYDYEIVDIVFNKLQRDRTKLATFSKICFLAAEEGCPVARKIFEDVAEELFKHIRSLSKTLKFDGKFVVSYTGGVFKAGKYVLEPLKAKVEAAGLDCIIQEPELDPWNGAALLAYKLAGNEVPSNVKEIMCD
ncbi:N-acetylglucosamine kinase [Clostridium chauvoei]|uniref:ATPase n=2 Tax=Clostridium chauvoei TaxID=46867 RepID=A0ABD4RHX7_9CLOT|nr:BadF/BadG/BcrA/BcrD ATPase family protein [Clostridium chauvoei]ATD56008.1 ATPase [Clostridium chauvoei]ATD56323.1 ATPase [Clostridium chauvoei]MBX7280907.1 ATPase [Clostridium chauvoei]MBX7283390.1 ATPase [Clostridium chauvoei]MBX7285927.1 ATPase [Clostridium chauvoei]